MIRGVLGRCCLLSSSFVRCLNNTQSQGLYSVATGMTPWSSWRDGVITTSFRISHWRRFSEMSKDSQDASSDIPNDSPKSRSNEVPNKKTDARILLNPMNSYQFEQYLKKLGTSQSYITYKKLVKLAQKKGVAATSTEIHQLLKEMFTSGVFLRYGDKVYLNPNEIVDRIRSVLPGSAEDTQKSIEALEVELEPLERDRKHLESKTAHWHKAIEITALCSLLIHYCYMNWSTFVESSWKEIAPLAYSNSLYVGIIVLMCCIVARRDLESLSLHSVIKMYLSRRAKIFDEAKYKAIVQQIETHRNFLSRLRP
eukprot:g4668.t1